jgi:hypothetical protein
LTKPIFSKFSIGKPSAMWRSPRLSPTRIATEWDNNHKSRCEEYRSFSLKFLDNKAHFSFWHCTCWIRESVDDSILSN